MSKSKPVHLDENNQVASVTRRLMGVLYDGMLVLALLFLMGLILTAVGTLLFGKVGVQASDAQALPAWYRHFVLSPSFLLTLLGFYGLFWRKSGQTLGMQTWRLKTVTNDGKLLTWAQSVLRILCATLVPLLCALVGMALYRTVMAAGLSAFLGLLLNYAFCWVHPKGLAIHDWLSRTLTVRIERFEHKGLFRK